MKIKDSLISYIDAGYPIIYINSFEETKTDAIIHDVMGGRKGLEWNGAHGFCDFHNKSPFMEDRTLAETLRMLIADKELDRKFLVIKDAHLYMDDPMVITCLKEIALKISKEDGLDVSGASTGRVVVMSQIWVWALAADLIREQCVR